RHAARCLHSFPTRRSSDLWLWPIIAAVLASCAISLTVQLVWRPLFQGSADGYAAIFVMHLVLLSSVAAIGALAFLTALRRRPGRDRKSTRLNSSHVKISYA